MFEIFGLFKYLYFVIEVILVLNGLIILAIANLCIGSIVDSQTWVDHSFFFKFGQAILLAILIAIGVTHIGLSLLIALGI